MVVDDGRVAGGVIVDGVVVLVDGFSSDVPWVIFEGLVFQVGEFEYTGGGCMG